jgi:hypothetical protein
LGTLVFGNAVVSYNDGAVVHLTHAIWREDPNDPVTSMVNGLKVRVSALSDRRQGVSCQ